MTDSTGKAPQIARDAWLAVRCQLGERESFDALIDRWHGPLWTYARRVTGADDAAHDVVQDVWLRVLRGLPGLRDPLRLRPWLFGIARRVLMDRLRTKYAAPPASDIDLETVSIEGPTATPADALEADALEADAAALQTGLDHLPVVEREVLTLFYLQELSLAEVAELLAVPVGTVKSRLHRARRMLRRAIAPLEGKLS